MHPFPAARLRLALALFLSLAGPQRASAQSAEADALVREALSHRPELAGALATLRAERQRAVQAGALPDPSLGLSLQNDGFTGLMVGKMETSFVGVVASQPLPFPGKRALREEVASLGAAQSQSGVARAALDIEAEVRGAFVDVLLSRERLRLGTAQEELWRQAEGAVRARYEAGEASQADLLRAQLEKNRVRQRQLLLEAGLRTATASLNRAVGRPIAAGGPVAVDVAVSLSSLAEPQAPEERAALDDAFARSPELGAAQLASRQARKSIELANRERFPDFVASAGVMARGALPPMWQAGLSVNLPIYADRKQLEAVAESGARAEAGEASESAVRQLLSLRTCERVELLRAALAATKLYRDGLRVQAQAAARSALSQYETGKVPFTAVTDAFAAFIGGEQEQAELVASAHRFAIALRAVRLTEDAAALPAPATTPSPATGGAPASPAAMSGM